MTSKGIEQFLGYLSDNRVQNLNNLVYVFNARKSSLQAAKQKMQTVFRNNAPLILKPLTQGGIGLAKVKQLFGSGINNVQDFLDATSVIDNNPIYNFIIIN